MKIRSGFVSNSSSSSFICLSCGDVESGWDASMSDFEFHACDKGHELCSECYDKYVGSLVDKYDQDIPEDKCPICQMKIFDPNHLSKYFLRKLGITEEEISVEIKNSFKSFKEFESYVFKKDLKK